MSKGYINLHRSILNWEWYADINVTRLFVHLILKVNYSEKKWRGKLVKEGQVITSISKLSSETNLTTKQVRLALNKLKRTNEVALQSTSQYTMIYVQNYRKYQEVKHQEGIREGKPGANEGQTKGKRRATTKEEEEGKKEEKKDTPKGVSKKKVANANAPPPPPNTKPEINYFLDNPPAVEAVERQMVVKRKSLIESGKLSSPEISILRSINTFLEAERFIAHYAENGWLKSNGDPMKDLSRSISKWILRQIKWEKERLEKNEKMSFRNGKLVNNEKSFMEEMEESFNAI